MKAMKLISVLALVLGAAAAQASIIMPDLRVKEQVGNFNPQPDPPGQNVEEQVGNFNPQPDPPGQNAEARIGTFNPQPEPPGKSIILQ